METILTKKLLSDSILLSDEELFGSRKSQKNWNIRFPEIHNKKIDKEFRLFLQYSIFDLKLTPYTVQRIVNSVSKIERLLNSKKYRKLSSLSDVDYFEFSEDVKKVFDKENFWKKYKKSNVFFSKLLEWQKWICRKKQNKEEINFDVEDIWYYEDLPFNVEKGASNMNRIQFSDFSVPWVKNAVKKVTYYKLERYCDSTCRAFVGNCKVFDSFVKQFGFTSPCCIDRQVIETELIPYARKKYPKPRPYNIFIGVMKSLFTTAAILGVEGFEQKNLFLKSDNMSKGRPDPKPYSDREKALMRKVCEELPPLDADIMNVQELQGFRIAEILQAKITLPTGEQSLKKENEIWIFTYYQFKTKRWLKMPLLPLAAEIIQKRIEISKKTYGDSCIYIFATGEKTYLASNAYRNHIKKIVAKNDYRGDDGNPLEATKTHTFRKTLATDFIQVTHDPKVVSLFLGQKNTGSLHHYIALEENERSEAMKKLHAENDLLVRHMGTKEFSVLEDSNIPNEKDQVIPLSNGSCCKPGNDICDHADSCYFCQMFQADRKYLQVYKMQHSRAKIAAQVAATQGLDTVADRNERIVSKLEKIIQDLEDFPWQSKIK